MECLTFTQIMVYRKFELLFIWRPWREFVKWIGLVTVLVQECYWLLLDISGIQYHLWRNLMKPTFTTISIAPLCNQIMLNTVEYRWLRLTKGIVREQSVKLLDRRKKEKYLFSTKCGQRKKGIKNTRNTSFSTTFPFTVNFMRNSEKHRSETPSSTPRLFLMGIQYNSGFLNPS